ncbi:FAD-dependent oxidoreductase [Cellulomonas sp. H30R-01]|uniref:NAD(P)/FAD-dependent oxidoreductase n=1 Tax=Cellulomonas sp. H30R-01 TaxID=2704467 RepID=UPI00138C8444|nr:FAD-dependent oxidoreductase [Cellulomonas sp. H30R-01]QHT55400.1 FAD-dependent oxidoreductase [Cellulomonas sp. H30R-01]
MATARTHPLWLDQILDDDPAALRPLEPLDGDDQADVVVVGAGLAGLWTAYYLLEADPSLDVLVVEADVTGAGATGHGSGWCSADLDVPGDALVRLHGLAGARALRAALRDAVVEVGGAAAAEQVDCGFAYGGSVRLARTPAEVERIATHVQVAADLEDDVHLLAPAEVAEHVRATGVLAGAYSADCARVQPAALALGLRDVVLSRGGRVVERTRAVRVSPRAVATDRGIVRTRWTVVATGAGASLTPGPGRSVVARHGVAVATAPLTSAQWDTVGLARSQTFVDADARVRGERTADGRLVLVDVRGLATASRAGVDRAATALHATLGELFPDLAGTPLTHAWSATVGVARDAHPSLGLDDDGIGWVRGLGFDGVAAANLAGRTLADLVTGAGGPHVRLPWVGHRSPAWPPAPVRLLGNAVARVSAARAPRARVPAPTAPR